MNIFNSLGSNYNIGSATEALFSNNLTNYSHRLKSYLESEYQGQAILVYKGREALELALKFLNLPENSLVAINGFTCYAVYKAIVNAGCKPIYLDIQGKNLNFTPNALKSELKKNPSIKVVIIQNTLGYPCNIEEVSRACKEKRILLIEDLAHSAGTIYNNQQQAGIVGDFTVLSFSQDKIIDGISGGALIIRNPKYQQKTLPELNQLANKQQIIDRFYPLFTYIIRSTYIIGLGKLIHVLLKKAGLLSNPMGNQKVDKIYTLPGWYCNLIYKRVHDLQNNLAHRKDIALIYAQKIDPRILSEEFVKNITNSTNLRFPIFVNDRDSLIKYLKGNGIHVSDIWYDAPLAPKKYLKLTSYNGQCPEAEKISTQILNLPTHQNVSQKQAMEISERVNKWLKLH